MVFSDYAPLDHILPRYLSVALLRRLNRKNIKTVGHSSLRWVGVANDRSFNPAPSSPPPPSPPDSPSSLSLGSLEGGPAAGVGKDVDVTSGAMDDEEGFDSDAARSGPIVLPPPASLSVPGSSDDNASGHAATAAESAASSLPGDQRPEEAVVQRKRRQRRRLQVMTAHSFDHLDTATHSTDRVVLAGVVSFFFFGPSPVPPSTPS